MNKNVKYPRVKAACIYIASVVGKCDPAPAYPSIRGKIAQYILKTCGASWSWGFWTNVDKHDIIHFRKRAFGWTCRTIDGYAQNNC